MKQFLESTDLLQTVASETEQVGREARSLVADLTDKQLNWKPAPDSWSIAQCLDHLAVTSEKFDQDFAKAIARGREKRRASGAVRYRPTMLGGWLVKQLLPDAKRRMRAPKVFRPSDSSSIEGAPERFLRQQERFLSFVNNARGIDYNKTRLRSPVTPLLRYSLADAFVMTVVHGQRHLAQARRVRETAGFPRP
jgi:DinB superfamily